MTVVSSADIGSDFRLADWFHLTDWLSSGKFDLSGKLVSSGGCISCFRSAYCPLRCFSVIFW